LGLYPNGTNADLWHNGQAQRHINLSLFTADAISYQLKYKSSLSEINWH
jgi:hypothetical protein